MARIGKILIVGAFAISATSFSASIYAQAPQQPQTPKSWNYTIGSNGQRVSKSNRITNPDGSWREEIRQGSCLTIKERSASGEYKETRQCNPKNPS